MPEPKVFEFGKTSGIIRSFNLWKNPHGSMITVVCMGVIMNSAEPVITQVGNYDQ